MRAFKALQFNLIETLRNLKKFEFRTDFLFGGFFYINFALIWLLGGLNFFYFSKLPSTIPLLYSQPWGSAQLSPRICLVGLVLLAITIFFLNAFLSEYFWQARERSMCLAVWIVSTFTLFSFFYSALRVVLKVVPSYEPSISGNLFLIGSFSFLLSFSVSHFIPWLASKLKAVDDPRNHEHPALLHAHKLPRAGALAFTIAFLVSSLIFLPLEKKLCGIYAGVIFMTVVGILDDRSASGACPELNPYLRLLAEIIAASLVVGAGVGIAFFRAPWNGIVRLDTLDIPLYIWGEHHILVWADLFALGWLVWVMNMLSWSNGVDGQFSGIVFISALVLAVLSLRSVGVNPEQARAAVLAVATAGAALGLLPFTWHPSKFLWGFGATASGLILGSLAIFSGAKIATAIMVLLVPTLDGLFAVLRRVLAGKSPVWGDRKHLHHYLLRVGLTQRQVAVFYWVVTAGFGTLALYTAEKYRALTLFTGIGLVGFFLALLNFGIVGSASGKKKKPQPQSNDDQLG